MLYELLSNLFFLPRASYDIYLLIFLKAGKTSAITQRHCNLIFVISSLKNII